MKNIQYDLEFGLDLPPDIQLKRMLRVMENELTATQRHDLELYYFQGMSVSQIARSRGVHVSTVLRSIRRAKDRLRRCLRY